MADIELHEYTTLKPKNSTECTQSVYDVPQTVKEDARSPPVDRIQDQVMSAVQQLQRSNTQDLAKTTTTILNANKLMGICLIMLFTINIVTLCLLVYVFETMSQNISDLLRISKSCQEVRTLFPSSTSGYYYINNKEVVYCEMGELCGADGGWSRLAYLDMTDNTVNCPSSLRYYSSGSVRACGRPTSNSASCASVTFPSHSISYSEVCGRVVGYQYGSPDGLEGPTDINSYYVDGVSITSGNPRTHVWTLMGEYIQNSALCPCSSQYSGSSVPSLIGNDYFCESGNPNSTWSPTLYTADPLWDGDGCSSYETGCCSGPPWFHKTIPTTTDYLEMRICGNQHTEDEDTPFSVYEIYVK